MQSIEYRITTEYIELNQLLKICGLAVSGGAGGALVSEGNVQVDGQQELRKRCKIRPGQVVQAGDKRITVLPPDPAEVAAKAEARVVKARERAAAKKVAPATAPWDAKKKVVAKKKPGFVKKGQADGARRRRGRNAGRAKGKA